MCCCFPGFVRPRSLVFRSSHYLGKRPTTPPTTSTSYLSPAVRILYNQIQHFIEPGIFGGNTLSGIATSIESLFDTALLTLCWRWWYVIRTNCCDVLHAVHHFCKAHQRYPNPKSLTTYNILSSHHLSQLQATNSHLHISSSVLHI